MWSYPNLVPLPAGEVERIGAALEPWPFERIYGAWWDRVVPSDAKDAVRRSVARYTRSAARRAAAVARARARSQPARRRTCGDWPSAA